jgi:hypothetical protein
VISPASNGGSTLSLSVSSSATPGTSSLSVTGASGSLSHTVPVSLTVGPPNGTGQWEYKLITSSTPDGLLTQATTLGAQGWELAGVTFDSTRSDSYVGFMKRLRGQ